MLRPESKQKKFAAERLPKFKLGILGKHSIIFKIFNTFRTLATFQNVSDVPDVPFHIYIYRYFANKQLFI